MLPNIVILFGGTSDERRVSVATAQNLSETLTQARLLFQNPQGFLFECSRERLLAHPRPFETDFDPKSQPFAQSLGEALDKADWKNTVFVLGLHGGSGEDGTYQKEFEKRKIAFTGSGSRASALAFNKRLAKKSVAGSIRTLPEAEVSSHNDISLRQVLQEMFEAHGKLILKPTSGGSSIGLFRVNGVSEIEDTIRELIKLPPTPYLIEPFVQGRELTIGVYETTKGLVALPPSEVLLQQGHNFDYEGKYLGRGSQEITPAQVTAMETEACQQMAIQAHKTLGCFGYTRTDLILTEGEPIYLETNTLPGLTKASFIPQQLAVAKAAFGDFLHQQIQLAWARTHGR